MDNDVFKTYMAANNEGEKMIKTVCENYKLGLYRKTRGVNNSIYTRLF